MKKSASMKRRFRSHMGILRVSIAASDEISVRSYTCSANGRHGRYIDQFPAAVTLTDTTDAISSIYVVILAFSPQ
jgi:hypothetical protein